MMPEWNWWNGAVYLGMVWLILWILGMAWIKATCKHCWKFNAYEVTDLRIRTCMICGRRQRLVTTRKSVHGLGELREWVDEPARGTGLL